MMSNTAWTSNMVQDILTWHLVDELLEVPHAERINRTAMHVTSSQTLSPIPTPHGLTAFLISYDDIRLLYESLRNTTWVRELVYPPAETGNISASLPFEKYAGAYYNPGYGFWYISCENGTLYNYMDRGPILQYDAYLEHISGDYFLAGLYNTDSPDDPMYFAWSSKSTSLVGRSSWGSGWRHKWRS